MFQVLSHLILAKTTDTYKVRLRGLGFGEQHRFGGLGFGEQQLLLLDNHEYSGRVHSIIVNLPGIF